MKIKFALLFLFVFIFSNVLIAQIKINQQDSLALAALFEATNGDDWGDHSNWFTEPSNYTSWYGVTFNDEGRVTDINLSENSLNGNIPPEIGNLANLQSLYLSGNPPELATL